MVTMKREPSVVVIQLSGGNDYLNTIVPYNEGLYYDFRTTVNIHEEKVLPLDGNYGFSPSMAPMKRLWDENNVAIINGITRTGHTSDRWTFGTPPNQTK